MKRSLWRYGGLALFLLIVLLLLLGLNMRRGLNHDEDQFIASGQLIATTGALPYRDFAYFHVPGLSLIYAALFRLSDQLLLTARLFSVLCAWLMLGLVAGLTMAELRTQRSWVRWLAAMSLVLLLIASPLFRYTSGRAWNHDLPMLLLLVAFWRFYRSTRPRSLLLVGLLLGLATATRLSFAFAALAFLLALLLWPQQSWAQRGRRISWLALGGVVGASPALFFLAWAPADFLFGNLTYIGLNTEYYSTLPDPPASMTLLGKLTFLGELLRTEPANVLVPLCLLLGLGWWWTRRTPLSFGGLPTLGLVALAMLASSLVATPLQAQYFYVLWPLAIVGLVLLLGEISRRTTDPTANQALPRLTLGLLAVSLLAGALSMPAYRAGLEIVFSPDEWYPTKLHARGAWAKTLVKQGTVLTIAPIIPLEAGLSIYPELATGPFAWRVAPLLSAAARREHALFTPDELLDRLADQPPRALLVGLDNDDAAVEAVLIGWAQSRGYLSLPMPDEGVLWLSPLASWGDKIRLGAHTLPQGDVAPGATLDVVFYLQNIQPIPQNLNILVRVLDPYTTQEVWREEGWPWGAATANWQPGEIWPDGHQITLPTNVATGCYRVEMSFYDPATFAPLGEATRIGAFWVDNPARPLTMTVTDDNERACP